MSSSGAAVSTNSTRCRLAAGPATTRTPSSGGFHLWEQPHDGLPASDGRKELLTNNVVIDYAHIVEGTPGSPEEDRGAPPPLALRRRRDPRRAHDGGGRGPLPRLLEESRHRRNHPAALPTGRGVRPARPDRGDVPRRQDQRDGGPGRPPCGPACSARPLHHG